MDEFELCDDIITVSDIAAECSNLLNDFDLVSKGRLVSLENVEPSSDKYTMINASYEDASNDLWNKIKTKVKNFLDWIKQLFQKLWNKIKTEVIDLEGDWMYQHSWEIKSTMEKQKPSDDDTIKVHTWNLENPSQEFLIDISYVKKLVDDLYSLSNAFVTALMTEPKRNKFNGKTTIEVKKELVAAIYDCWGEFCKTCKIPKGKEDSPTTIGENDVKNAIRSKYYSEKYLSGDTKFESVRVDKFAGNYKFLDAMYSKSGTQEIKWICDNISKRSAGSAMYLRELDEFIAKLERDSRINPDNAVTIDNAKVGVINIINNVSKVALAVGSEYWLLYMNLRADMKRAAKKWFEIYKRNK